MASAEINQCVRPAWRYYLLFRQPRRSTRVLGVLARGVLGLFTRTFDFRTGKVHKNAAYPAPLEASYDKAAPAADDEAARKAEKKAKKAKKKSLEGGEEKEKKKKKKKKSDD